MGNAGLIRGLQKLLARGVAVLRGLQVGHDVMVVSLASGKLGKPKQSTMLEKLVYQPRRRDYSPESSYGAAREGCGSLPDIPVESICVHVCQFTRIFVCVLFIQWIQVGNKLYGQPFDAGCIMLLTCRSGMKVKICEGFLAKFYLSF
jgi:hypothetical protein